MKRVLRSLNDTRTLGSWLAARVKPGDVVALDGDLGAGKTALVKMLAAAWGADESEIRSPTFGLIHIHDLPSLSLVHADLYRMSEQQEVQSCGLLDYLGDPGAVVAIEWPELAEGYLPLDAVRIRMALLPDGTREVSIELPAGR
jgi:tRNA threonylcarbamoyladenosine biosynthesis protein TsaE